MTLLIRASRSFEVRDVAAYSTCRRHLRFAAFQNGLQGVVKLVDRRLRASMAKGQVPVVDASVIRELTAGIEDRDLRRDLCLAQLNQRMLWIVQSRKLVSVGVQMLLDRRAGLRLVRIHQPECNPARILRTEPLNCGSVAIGDGTIGSHEYQNYRLAGISAQRVHRLACKINSGWWLICANACSADPSHHHDYEREIKHQHQDCGNALPIAVHRPSPLACSDFK